MSLLFGDFRCLHDASSGKGVKVDLSDNDLTDTCVDDLASFLRDNACVKEMRLGGNFFEEEGIEKLIESAGSHGAAIITGEQRVPPWINLILRGDDETQLSHHKCLRTTALGRVFDEYCARHNLDCYAMRFIFEGCRLDPDGGSHGTAESMEMIDGDVIEVFPEQVGD
jgi:hypothetical protein